MLFLGLSAAEAVVKAEKSPTVVLSQHANSSSVVLTEHQSLYRVCESNSPPSVLIERGDVRNVSFSQNALLFLELTDLFVRQNIFNLCFPVPTVTKAENV